MLPSLCVSVFRRTGSILALFLFVTPLLVLLLLLGGEGLAKEPPLNAIVLYDSEKGTAYEQVSDLLINGKIELRICSPGQPIDKSAYGRLPKTTLAGATSLERTADGVLILTKDSGPSCVVPANVKFDHDASFTASELAEKAVLQGSTASGQSPPALKPGVKLVFVAAPDTELAEYLRAERNGTIVGWQDFLARYPDSTYTTKAKPSLASLLAKDGEDHLAAYKRSLSGDSPFYSTARFFERDSFFELLEQLLDMDYCFLIQRDNRYKKQNRYCLTHFHVKIDWPIADAAESLAKELRYISKNLYEKGDRYAEILQQKLFEYYGCHHQATGGRRSAALIAAQYLKKCALPLHGLCVERRDQDAHQLLGKRYQPIRHCSVG